MIAYNKQWLANLQIAEQAEQALEANCITKEEQGKILAAYPEKFYSPNFFVRIGLFILTCIIVFFTLGLVSLMIFSTIENESLAAVFIVYGLLVYAGLEFMVNKRHYKSGVDDA